MDENQAYRSVRTDLATEAKDMKKENDLKGITTSEKTIDDIRISYVDIDEQGASLLNKNAGSYITIYADGVKEQDTKKQTDASKVVSTSIKELLKKNNISDDAVGLVVGLGNWQVTPDALGPMTVDKILVTSHLFALDHETVAGGYRSVAAVAPGVMGVTGMETSEVTKGIIEKFQPDFVIALDALASKSIDRINETIQLSDAGINPGSGVGNERKELNQNVLGIPVIAAGVPTVVDAVTITSDAIDYLLKHFGRELKESSQPSKALAPAGLTFGKKTLAEEDLPDNEQREKFLGVVGTLDETEKRKLIGEVLGPIGHNMIVTPKEVDGFMEDMASLLASGLNAALHDTITVREASEYTR